MPPLRDIRDFIPKTNQTNPNKFPAVAYQRYPLMAVDGDTGKPFLDEANRTVHFLSKEEEDAFHADHPTLREFKDPEDLTNELEQLREENRRLKAQRASNADDGKDIDPDAAKTVPGAKDDAKGVAGLIKGGGKAGKLPDRLE